MGRRGPFNQANCAWDRGRFINIIYLIILFINPPFMAEYDINTASQIHGN